MNKSFEYAFAGIYEGWRNHPNFRRQIAILIGTAVLGWRLNISPGEWVAVVLAGGLVLSAEMGNTAIEAAVNLATDERRPEAKIAKDAGAGGVLMAAVAAAVVGLIVFLPKLISTIYVVISSS